MPAHDLSSLYKEMAQLELMVMNKNNYKEINLGYMSISENKWTIQKCYCKECDPIDGDDIEHEGVNIDPSEIIEPSKEITILYDYPLNGTFQFKHTTENSDGFTRKELSEQIMTKYHQIYKEEEEDEADKISNLPGMLNRQTSYGKYGIWGHHIEDLYLHTLYKDSTGIYSLGIDS